jgi:hypothetical protein
LVFGLWSLVFGRWSLVVGLWFLVVGGWIELDDTAFKVSVIILEMRGFWFLVNIFGNGCPREGWKRLSFFVIPSARGCKKDNSGQPDPQGRAQKIQRPTTKNQRPSPIFAP